MMASSLPYGSRCLRKSERLCGVRGMRGSVSCRWRRGSLWGFWFLVGVGVDPFGGSGFSSRIRMPQSIMEHFDLSE